MHIPSAKSAKLASPVVLLLALASCPCVWAQSQTQTETQDSSQSQPCTTAATTAGNTTPSGNKQEGNAQQQSPQPVSQAAQNVKDSFKALGSVFSKKKKKDPAANGTAAAASPCSPSPSKQGANAPAPATVAPTPNSAPDQAGSASQGTSAVWTPPSDKSSAATAPAGPLDPARLPDVVGVHMGMAREEVPATLLKLHPNGSTLPEGPDTVAGLAFNLTGAPGSGDNIHVEFTLPPDKQRVYFVERWVHYQQAMAYDNFLAAVRQKYGQELFTDIGGDTKYWLFDEQGHLIPPDKDAHQQSPYGCNPDNASGKMMFLNLVRTYTHEGLAPATLCDSAIILMIQAGPGPVNSIHTFLEDRALLRREVAVTGEAAKAEAQKKQQQDLKNAKQAKPNL